MRKSITISVASICFAMFASNATAQPAAAAPKDGATSTIVTKMMAFDKNKDGKLTKDEITDPRLVRLFDQADSDKDGVVTKEELTALATKLEAEVPAGGGRGGRGGGPDDGGPGGPGGGGPGGFDGGPGGPGGGGPGGPGGGGPGGPGGGRGRGMPQPGQVLPPMLQDALQLSADQKKQVAELQKDVDTKLAKILTEAQLNQMKQMRQRGPGMGGPGGGGPGGQGGGGGQGGPGGPGGPGGGGPGGQGGPGGGGPPR